MKSKYHKYTITDFYRKYKSEQLRAGKQDIYSQTVYTDVIATYFSYAIDKLLDTGQAFSFPKKMGKLKIIHRAVADPKWMRERCAKRMKNAKSPEMKEKMYAMTMYHIEKGLPSILWGGDVRKYRKGNIRNYSFLPSKVLKKIIADRVMDVMKDPKKKDKGYCTEINKHVDKLKLPMP